jgi:hypothetical protein
MNRLYLMLLAGMVAAPATAQPFILELKPKLKEAYPPPPSPTPVAPPKSDTTTAPKYESRGQAAQTGDPSQPNLPMERGSAANGDEGRGGAEDR